MVVKTWKQAKQLRLERSSPCGTYTGIIDPGVNYFVLQLEKLGAVTHYSCEGHPNGFYVSFLSPITTALMVKYCGYFAVEIENCAGLINGEAAYYWRISLPAANRTEKDKVRTLSLAAAAWTRNMGPVKTNELIPVQPKQKAKSK